MTTLLLKVGGRFNVYLLPLFEINLALGSQPLFLGGDPSAGSPTDTLLRLNPPR